MARENKKDKEMSLDDLDEVVGGAGWVKGTEGDDIMVGGAGDDKMIGKGDQSF